MMSTSNDSSPGCPPTTPPPPSPHRRRGFPRAQHSSASSGSPNQRPRTRLDLLDGKARRRRASELVEPGGVLAEDEAALVVGERLGGFVEFFDDAGDLG